MKISGQQLHIVTTDQVVDNVNGWGVRVTIEAAPLEGRETWAARVVVSHALLPGRRQVLGLLAHDVDDQHTDLVVGVSPQEVEGKVGEVLRSISKRLRFSPTPDEPARLLVGEVGVAVEATKHLH